MPAGGWVCLLVEAPGAGVDGWMFGGGRGPYLHHGLFLPHLCCAWLCGGILSVLFEFRVPSN
jgi:hypothetical protein